MKKQVYFKHIHLQPRQYEKLAALYKIADYNIRNLERLKKYETSSVGKHGTRTPAMTPQAQGTPQTQTSTKKKTQPNKNSTPLTSRESATSKVDQKSRENKD